MASDTFPGLELEINQALDVLEPQIRGMTDLTRVSLSSPTLNAVQAALAVYMRRRMLLDQVNAGLVDLKKALDELIADGYPGIDKAKIDADEFQELQEQSQDIAAAIAAFNQAAAESVSISLGQPATKA